VACDDEMAFSPFESDISFSEIDKGLVNTKQTSKSIFTDRIAKDLLNSHNKVNNRLLKLHRIANNSHQTTELIDFLGVKENLSKNLFKNFAQS